MPTVQTKEMLNYIGGKWTRSRSGKVGENRNPADDSEVVGTYQESTPQDVDDAVAAAKQAYPSWRLVPAPRRAEMLFKVGAILAERKEAYARDMTREMGKILAETRGDVQEGIDTAYYAATIGRQLAGRTVPSEMPNKWAMSFRRPIGVAGIVTPFNFPLAIPTWKMFPALVCGNACVFKPAEDVPHTGHVLVEIMLEAGLPPEVIQLVHGLGES